MMTTSTFRSIPRLFATALAFLGLTIAQPSWAICPDGIVDIGEDCDSLLEPCCDLSSCTFQPAGTICNPLGSGDACDPPDTCDGTSGACPVDLAAGGTVCRAGSADLCDPDETCTGVPLAPCPPDIVLPALTTCRLGSLDACDPTESCTGVAGEACPADVITPGGTVCRSGSGDFCDPDETCTGTPGAPCPVDSFELAGTTCRVATSTCDIAETCPGGAGGACPADAVEMAGLPCSDSLYCTDPDTCDGSGGCTGGPPRNCDDANICTADSCSESGDTCVNSAADACDDGNPCTTDSCNLMTGCAFAEQPPLAGCYDDVKSRFSMREDDLYDYKSHMRWAFRKGDDVPLAAIGSPQTTTTYGFCVYDQISSTPTLVAGMEVPPDSFAWRIKNGKARYNDGSATFGGVTNIKVKTGLELKTSASLKAQGFNLDLPFPYDGSTQFAVEPSLIVQLFNSAGHCWTSNIPASEVKINVPGHFKGKDQ